MVRVRSVRRLVGVHAALAVLLAVPAGPARAATAGASEFQQAVAAAAAEFHVPEEVLLGVSYQASWWEDNGDRPSTLGGYGPMHLTDTTAGRTSANRPGEGPVDATGSADPAEHTLNTAARLIHVSPDRLRSDEHQNIRAGAALLASYQRTVTRSVPADPGGWYAAVARYSQAGDRESAAAYADAVYASLRTGLTRTRKDGQRVELPAHPDVVPDTGQLSALGLRRGVPRAARAECPTTLNCRFVPAAATNYQVGSRPQNDVAIDTIVIHDIEGSYQAGVETFQDPSSGVSAHYILSAEGAEATQMVATKDVAFHAGNYWVNMHSVGIEHTGYAAQGAGWFTPATYRATADLVRYLAQRFGVPLDRQHVIGHENVLTASAATVSDSHWDPGPFWDWQHFMDLLTPGAGQDAGRTRAPVPTGEAVTITPDFRRNLQTVRVCSDSRAVPRTRRTTAPSAATCKKQRQSANMLFVRTAPRADAPLFGDRALHSAGSAGTDRIDDWGSTVVSGQQFVVAGRTGDWTAIWYAGAKGWIHDPAGRNTTRAPGARIVRPRPGPAAVPVYVTAYPEPHEYPEGLTPSAQRPLGIYSVPQGQAYVSSIAPRRADDFFPATPSRPESVVTGRATYDLIQYSHRTALLDHADTLAGTEAEGGTAPDVRGS
ncbi:peptidoglycan recognition family protein [Streptomyces sp. NPDC089919]|uniref:N-acetylmuramoyl-L-alanine amidase n=1 Tax=Streptomyces sp. NPDC089919 TaxID=3155188 RepID=UPI003441FBA2